MNQKNNSLVILVVVSTVCLLAAVGVGTLAFCAIYKIPDMSGSMSAALTQTTSTLVGALIACLINTRAQEPRKEQDAGPSGTVSDPVSTVVTNPPNQPVPVENTDEVPSPTETIRVTPNPIP